MADQKTYAATQLLKGIGLTPNADNLRLASGWIQSEGGLVNSSNNPLNTTLNAPGTVGSVNSVGVKKFGNLDQGIAADVSTLQNSRYAGIRQALASGKQDDFIKAVGTSPWGTSADLLGRVLGSGAGAPPSATPAAATPASASPAPTQASTPAAPTTTVQPPPQLDLSQALVSGQMAGLLNRQPGQSLADAALKGGSSGMMSAAAANDAASRAAEAQQANKPVDPSAPTGEAAQGAPTTAAPPAKGAAGAAAWTQQHLGVKYVYGGNDPKSGIDCSAFTQHAWATQGVTLPRTTYDQIKTGQPVANLAQAQPGDLLFPSDHHVMLYLGNGQAAEAPHTGDVTKNIPVAGMSFIAIRRPGT